MTADDKTLINVTFSNVKMTYEKVDPNAVKKEDISLEASFWGWGYKSNASNADDGSLIITNTEATGAGSFGYNPTKDWSGYKTLEIVLGDQTEWKGAAWAQVTIQNVGIEVINALGSLDRILFPDDVRSITHDILIHAHTLRTGNHQLHAGQFGCQHQRVGNVALAVTVECHADGGINFSAVFPDRQHISNDLAGVVVIGQSIDHRNRCNTGKFLNTCLRERTDDDTVQITAQNICGIGDRFTSADLHFALIQIKGCSAKLTDANLK